METQIILRKLKLFYGNWNYFTKTQIILQKLKLFYGNSNYFTKTQIILRKLKLLYKNSNKAFREMTKNPLFKTPHDLKLTLQKFKGCKSLFQLKSFRESLLFTWNWVMDLTAYDDEWVSMGEENSINNKFHNKNQILAQFQNVVQNLKLLYKISNFCTKTQIDVWKLKLMY